MENSHHLPTPIMPWHLGAKRDGGRAGAARRDRGSPRGARARHPPSCQEPSPLRLASPAAEHGGSAAVSRPQRLCLYAARLRANRSGVSGEEAALQVMAPFPAAEFFLAPTSFGAVKGPKKEQEGKETGRGLVIGAAWAGEGAFSTLRCSG